MCRRCTAKETAGNFDIDRVYLNGEPIEVILLQHNGGAGAGVIVRVRSG